jgi:hypothetical protein
MWSSLRLRVSSVVLLFALVAGASSALWVGTQSASACTQINPCGAPGPGNSIAAVAGSLNPAPAASAAVVGLTGAVTPPPPVPTVIGTAVEYQVLLALIIVACIGSV